MEEEPEMPGLLPGQDPDTSQADPKPVSATSEGKPTLTTPAPGKGGRVLPEPKVTEPDEPTKKKADSLELSFLARDWSAYTMGEITQKAAH
jgi:hypothetical protein